MSMATDSRNDDELANLDAFLLPEPRDHLTSATTRAMLGIQQTALAATREYLREQGFAELLPPIIGPVTDPGGRGSKQVDVDYYGRRYKLMTSAILYKQASLLTFDKIFYIAPNIRLEPLETATTGRHLAEFHQIDVEMAGASRAQIMTVAEQLLMHVVDRVSVENAAQLDSLGQDAQTLRAILGEPFDRRPHNAVTAELIAAGHPQSPDAEIDWLGERLLSEASARPFFVVDYPKGSRGFYDREDPDSPGILQNFDLVLPGGYGELCSGSEREYEYGRIVARIRETAENPAKYGWYLKLVREGIPASSGFGMGVERLTRYLAGLDSIWQASAYPKIPGLVSP
jgi:asparaginyl-tRNA synthetase